MKQSLFILYVSDQKVSRDFYSAVLGKDPQLDVPGMTEFSLGDGASLGLMPETGIRKLLGGAVAKPMFGSGVLRGEVYLMVDDPEECLDRAVGAGAKLLSQCQDRNWGDYTGYCLDRDGYVLGFGKPSGNSIRKLDSQKGTS